MTTATERSETESWQTERILGLPIRSLAPDRCVAELDRRVEEEAPVRLGFVNIYTAYLISNDPAYQEALRPFVLLNDGVGLDLVSLILHGRRFAHNLNGTDFVPLYLRSTRHSYRVFLLGAKPGIAEAALDVLRKRAPQHTYVGACHGYFTPEENEGILERISTAKADLVIVALGNPGQEQWIASNVERTGARLAIGVGALFDFLTGTVPRAPLWMRNARLEWLYRMLQEPKRLAMRYCVYAPTVLIRALALGNRSVGDPSQRGTP